ncbi:MAG: hypothetical protein HGN29_16600 [Asgard group archaeon]|nr:hypothetical protein [Asgard group archaeon]
MNIYKLKLNDRTLRSFNCLDEALEYMHIKFEENKIECIEEDIHLRLIHESDDHSEILLQLPQVEKKQLEDFHPLIQNLFKILYDHQDELLLELDLRLKTLDRLDSLHYTEDIANNNILDLVKLADLTKFSVLHCPTCKKLQQATAEGCSGLIFFICNECDSIIVDLHRRE